MLGRAKEIHQRAVWGSRSPAPFEALGIPDPSSRMACSHHLARLELQAYRCGTQLAGGFRHGVLAQACGDAERVDCAPCPEWPTAECQAMLARWYGGQSVRSHHPAAFIDNQGTSDELLDILRRSAC